MLLNEEVSSTLYASCKLNMKNNKDLCDGRLLVSFAGKYLKYDYCVALPRGPTEGCSSLDHQLCKIYIPHVDPNVFGPAFIEVGFELPF